MILQAMFFVLGLVVAALVGLTVIPGIVRRASKAAQARLEASFPSSRAEIEAEKDHLRARFAVANRRLEASIARLTRQLAARMVEGNQLREEVVELRQRQSEGGSALAALERRAAELTTTLERAEHRLSAVNAELVLREERLTASSGEIHHLRSDIAVRELLTEEQRLELVARDTAIGNLKDALAAAEASAAALAASRDELQRELERERAGTTDRNDRDRRLVDTITSLEAERSGHAGQLERQAMEIAALRSDLAAASAMLEEAAALEKAISTLHLENAELRARMMEILAAVPAAVANGQMVAVGNGPAIPAQTDEAAEPNGTTGNTGAPRPAEPLPGRPERRDPRSIVHRLRAIQGGGTRH